MSKSPPHVLPPLPTETAADRANYWPFAVARAIPLLVAGLVVTFSADHSAAFGLRVFGAFAIVNGLLVGLVAWRRLSATRSRGILVAVGAISTLCGGAALAFGTTEVSSLLLILTLWAAITGALELYAGLRCRGRHVASGDLMTVGALTAVAAVVFVVLPSNFSQTFTGPDQVRRVLDSAVVAVGLFGAYAMILAVYLLVAGLSAKWGTQGVDPIRADSGAAAPGSPAPHPNAPTSESTPGNVDSRSDFSKGTTP